VTLRWKADEEEPIYQFNAQIAAARRQRAFEDMQVLGAEISAESSR
jgi:hypothetical protein